MGQNTVFANISNICVLTPIFYQKPSNSIEASDVINRKLLLFMFALFVHEVAAGPLSPTPYVEMKSCSFMEELKLRAYCFGGYSDVKITPSKYLIKAEGNEFTSEERTIQIAMKRCAEIAINSDVKYIKIVSVSSETKQEIVGANGNVSTVSHPVAKLTCALESTESEESLNAQEAFDLKF